MLENFTSAARFNGLRLSVHVDVDSRESTAFITYDRRVVGQERVSFHDTRTPALAEKWITAPYDRHGSRLEHLERQYRTQAPGSRAVNAYICYVCDPVTSACDGGSRTVIDATCSLVARHAMASQTGAAVENVTAIRVDML